VLVEHARTLLGIADASHAESSSDGTPIVALLSCSLDGHTIDVALTPGTRLAALHGGAPSVTESTTCSYGLDPAWQHVALSSGMVVAGVDDTGEVRAVERPDHPFFVATLYQPQLRSSPGAPHPVWSGFLAACMRTRDGSAGRCGAS
jgi:CTP synthase (UTP-ammonia lyase)